MRNGLVFTGVTWPRRSSIRPHGRSKGFSAVVSWGEFCQVRGSALAFGACHSKPDRVPLVARTFSVFEPERASVLHLCLVACRLRRQDMDDGTDNISSCMSGFYACWKRSRPEFVFGSHCWFTRLAGSRRVCVWIVVIVFEPSSCA